MVEIQHFARAIMAGQAIIAKALTVLGHKRRVTFTMAIGTTRLRKGQVVIGMAVLALEGAKAQVFMFFERERGLFVRKIGPVQYVDWIVTATVVCMTGFAVGHGPEHAVETLAGIHVIGFLGVTFQAPVLHVVGA